MFCPRCKDEFREGFTRCAGCNVDLVDSLDEVKETQASTPTVSPGYPVRMVDFCGFFELADAREARDRLRGRRIRSEIVLRDHPDASWDDPAREEPWLRVEASRLREVQALLDEGMVTSDTSDEGEFSCGECGHLVAAAEAFCAKCGARFEGD